MTTLTTRGRRGRSRTRRTRDAGRAKNLFALGVLSWLYGRPTDVTERWIEAEVRAAGRGARGEPRRVQRRLVVRRDHRAARRAVPGQPGDRRRARAPTATSTARRRLALGLVAASVRSGLPLLLGQLPDHARLRAAARALAPRQASACARSRPRTRSPPPGWRSAPRSAAALGVTATSGPGMDLKAETIGLAVDAGAADGHRRRAARRAVDRDADEDRAVRPADGAVRPPRRVAAAGDRAEHAGRLLRRRVRGGADGGPLPHAGDPAVATRSWRLRRSRGRFRTSPTCRRSTRASRPRATASDERRSCPTPRRGRRAAVGDPGHARASQHRIGGLEKTDGTGNISYDGANHAR